MKKTIWWLALTLLTLTLAMAVVVSCGDDDDDDDDTVAGDDDTINPDAIDCTDFCGTCAGCLDAEGFDVPECNVGDTFDATACFEACEAGELDPIVYTLPDGDFQGWTCEEFNDFFAG